MSERKPWVLDTETKGTGAHMVPLESVERHDAPAEQAKIWVPRKRTPREPQPPEPRKPRRFRVVDVLSRRTLLEDGSVREMLELLGGVDRITDVNIFVWEDGWRLLTLDERRAVWDRRKR